MTKTLITLLVFALTTLSFGNVWAVPPSVDGECVIVVSGGIEGVGADRFQSESLEVIETSEVLEDGFRKTRSFSSGHQIITDFTREGGLTVSVMRTSPPRADGSRTYRKDFTIRTHYEEGTFLEDGAWTYRKIRFRDREVFETGAVTPGGVFEWKKVFKINPDKTRSCITYGRDGQIVEEVVFFLGSTSASASL